MYAYQANKVSTDYQLKVITDKVALAAQDGRSSIRARQNLTTQAIEMLTIYGFEVVQLEDGFDHSDCTLVDCPLKIYRISWEK